MPVNTLFRYNRMHTKAEYAQQIKQTNHYFAYKTLMLRMTSHLALGADGIAASHMSV